MWCWWHWWHWRWRRCGVDGDRARSQCTLVGGSPLGVFPKRSAEVLRNRHEQAEVQRTGPRTLHQHTRHVRWRRSDHEQPTQRPPAGAGAGVASGVRSIRPCSNPTHDRAAAGTATVSAAAAHSSAQCSTPSSCPPSSVRRSYSMSHTSGVEHERRSAGAWFRPDIREHAERAPRVLSVGVVDSPAAIRRSSFRWTTWFGER